ncbi:four helix bundle protein [candidate division WS5 bacterium]|uniref:Four helix bundle protein n=1 Tax=candidate division WS5 bacterium TaxID=2093353 RepID=A0A419DFV4_9BACT|nr:MAG: four helix bundle protein [candidate division WS5 bacterium]
MFRFKKFKVYQDSLEFTKNIRYLTEKFPKNEMFGLKSQIIRASDSVVLNIAEGSDRYSDKDFSRFLNQAVASVAEVSACLDIALKCEYISSILHEKYQTSCEEIYKQLKAFCSKVREDSVLKKEVSFSSSVL